jgi:hypothetical protein
MKKSHSCGTKCRACGKRAAMEDKVAIKPGMLCLACMKLALSEYCFDIFYMEAAANDPIEAFREQVKKQMKEYHLELVESLLCASGEFDV